MAGEETVPLMETPPDVVTHQPQATSGISTLSMIIKALLGEKESRGCYCLFHPQQESPKLASALLIGTMTEDRGQPAGGQHPRSNPDYINVISLNKMLRYLPVSQNTVVPKMTFVSSFLTSSQDLTHPYSFCIIVVQLMTEEIGQFPPGSSMMKSIKILLPWTPL